MIVWLPAAMPLREEAEVMIAGHWPSAWAMFPTPTTRYPSHRLQCSVTSQAIDVSTEDDVILVAGSLYVAGAARTAVEDFARRGE